MKGDGVGLKNRNNYLNTYTIQYFLSRVPISLKHTFESSPVCRCSCGVDLQNIRTDRGSLRILTDYTFKFSIERPKLTPKGYPPKIVSIGDKIRKHRIDLGLYQKDVARFIGVSTCTIMYWETNRFKPYNSRMPVIQKFLSVKEPSEVVK